MMNVYSGNISTNANGYATVTLPDYFEAANKDFRYQLTVIGSFTQVIVKEKKYHLELPFLIVFRPYFYPCRFLRHLQFQLMYSL